MPPVCAITSPPFHFHFIPLCHMAFKAFRTFLIFMPHGHTTYMRAYTRTTFIYSCLTASNHCSCLTAHRTSKCLICSCLRAQHTRPPLYLPPGLWSCSLHSCHLGPPPRTRSLAICALLSTHGHFSIFAVPHLPLSPLCHMPIYAVLASKFPANCNWALRVAGHPSDLPPFLICVTTFASITFIGVVIAIFGPIYSNTITNVPFSGTSRSFATPYSSSPTSHSSNRAFVHAPSLSHP